VKPPIIADNVRAADAKEVGVGNPAEETYCHPNAQKVPQPAALCQLVIPFWGLYPIPIYCSISHSLR
jgi:hypothetical protein